MYELQYREFIVDRTLKFSEVHTVIAVLRRVKRLFIKRKKLIIKLINSQFYLKKFICVMSHVSYVNYAFTENICIRIYCRETKFERKWHHDSVEHCRLQIWMTLSLRHRYINFHHSGFCIAVVDFHDSKLFLCPIYLNYTVLL